MKKFLCLLLCLLTLLSFSACKSSGAGSRGSLVGGESGASAADSDKKVKIVTTIFPPYDFARQIAKDRAEITMLIKPGSESHTYEPTLSDIAAIQNCDLFIYVGGQTDAWVQKILSGNKNKNRREISLLSVVKTYKEEIREGMTAEHHDDDSNKLETDEHVWTSPFNAMEITKVISETLCDKDSKNTAFYTENKDRFLEKLQLLNKDFESAVKSAKRKTLVFADRFPFRYFTEQYGLKYYAALPGCSSDTEPTLNSVQYLLNVVKSEKIPVVLYIEFSKATVADKISSITGAKKRQFHSCHNVSPEDFSDGVTYIDLMRQNLAVLKEALN